MNTMRFVILATLGIIGCTTNTATMEQPHTIIFFGDSITELGDRPNGYVALVRDSLTSAGVQSTIVGAGVSGNKVTDLEKRLENDVLAKKPSAVVIYIGINDVWHYQFADRGLSGTPKEQYRQILGEIIDKIRSEGAGVILCTPSVIGEKKGRVNRWDAMLDEYSGISREVAAERNIPLLDLRKEFTAFLDAHNASDADSHILTNDGVHLNDAGNRFVAGLMIGALEAYGIFSLHQ